MNYLGGTKWAQHCSQVSRGGIPVTTKRLIEMLRSCQWGLEEEDVGEQLKKSSYVVFIFSWGTMHCQLFSWNVVKVSPSFCWHPSPLFNPPFQLKKKPTIDQLCPLPGNKCGCWLLLCYPAKLNTFMLMISNLDPFLGFMNFKGVTMLTVLLCLWKIACIDKLHYCKPPTALQMSVKCWVELEVEGEECSK